MTVHRRATRLIQAITILAMTACLPVLAQYNGVAGTVHNLSASGPGEIKAVEETRVCRFCHIPHNTQTPQALWSQTLSRAEYRTPEIRSGGGTTRQAPQPNGSSRLCLSCHDGTVALGELAGGSRRIAMQGTQRLLPGRGGHLGTDLSGSHPVSFVMPEGDPDLADSGRDIGLKPLSVVMSSSTVGLDSGGRMQCTTCHDPHSDSNFREGSVPRFWVAPSVSEVCLTCHALR